jgi:hypothetical protein
MGPHDSRLAFPSADVMSGGVDVGTAYVMFARGVDTQQGAERKGSSIDWVRICNGDGHYVTRTITPFTDARN